MTAPESQPAPPPTPPFQFTLRTLLLLFVVLGSSLAVFGGWGVVVFGLAAVFAMVLRRSESGTLRGARIQHRPGYSRIFLSDFLLVTV